MKTSTRRVGLAIMFLFFRWLSQFLQWRMVSDPVLISLDVHPCDDLPGDYNAWRSSAQRVGVVIVGGGVAGMTAAKSLIENNFTDLLLLEADNYLGGRVHTHREGNILVEDGAEWIHGGELNPLYRLADKLNWVAPYLPRGAYDFKVSTMNGIPSDPSKYKVIDLMKICMAETLIANYSRTSYGQCYLDKFPDTYGAGADSSLGKAWLHLLEQIVNYEEGTDSWLDSSARDTGRYANYGLDYQWKDGYDTFLKYLKAAIPHDLVRLSTPVCGITWDGADDDKVLVVTKGGQSTYVADYVIVTTSVGHLKDRHQELFRPSLPPSFLKDLSEIELGVVDKVQLGWDEPWWGSKPLWHMILWTQFDLSTQMEWLYGIVQVMSVHQQKGVLQVFVTGHHATAMEKLPEEIVRSHLLNLISNVTNTRFPQPSFFRRSQWGNNPWTRGAYSSSVTVEGDRAGIRSRKPFQIPLKNSKGKTVVLWAGEHTHTTHYSTVDGAMSSGQRVAIEVLELLKAKGQ